MTSEQSIVIVKVAHALNDEKWDYYLDRFGITDGMLNSIDPELRDEYIRVCGKPYFETMMEVLSGI